MNSKIKQGWYDSETIHFLERGLYERHIKEYKKAYEYHGIITKLYRDFFECVSSKNIKVKEEINLGIIILRLSIIYFNKHIESFNDILCSKFSTSYYNQRCMLESILIQVYLFENPDKENDFINNSETFSRNSYLNKIKSPKLKEIYKKYYHKLSNKGGHINNQFYNRYSYEESLPNGQKRILVKGHDTSNHLNELVKCIDVSLSCFEIMTDSFVEMKALEDLVDVKIGKGKLALKEKDYFANEIRKVKENLSSVRPS